jgi:hypothetical protein
MINWIQPVVKKSENCSNWPKSVDQLCFEQSQFEQFTRTPINNIKIDSQLWSFTFFNYFLVLNCIVNREEK